MAILRQTGPEELLLAPDEHPHAKRHNAANSDF